MFAFCSAKLGLHILCGMKTALWGHTDTCGWVCWAVIRLSGPASLLCFTPDVNENSLSSPPVQPERWDGKVVHFWLYFGLAHTQKTFFHSLVVDALLAIQSPNTNREVLQEKWLPGFGAR